jgi:hypothetical protein
MKTRLIRRAAVAGATVAVLCLSTMAAAVTPLGPGSPVTGGPKYDRNPSVVQDGALTRMFFARTEVSPCDRLPEPNCPADNTTYDLYEMDSTDGGATWGTPFQIADNSQFPNSPWNNPSYGRTVAATRTPAGDVHVFWSSGGNTSSLVYGVDPAGAGGFTWGSRSDLPVFNVEAINLAGTTILYFEDGIGGDIEAMTFDGSNFGPPTSVVPVGNIPKAIVDSAGVVRLTYVNASAWPVVNVLIASSADGFSFGPSTVVVTGDGGITNWDPTLVQTPDGAYHLFHAPDQVDDRQIIEHRTSPTFEGLAGAAPVAVTTGTNGTTQYWDYWPEAFVNNNVLRLLYTSEAGADPGTGHIWATSTALTPVLTHADQCKKGGYANFGFKNQGQCVAAAPKGK